MKGRYPLHPFRVPILLAVATAVALVAALVYYGAVEICSNLVLSAVVTVVVVALLRRARA